MYNRAYLDVPRLSWLREWWNNDQWFLCKCPCYESEAAQPLTELIRICNRKRKISLLNILYYCCIIDWTIRTSSNFGRLFYKQTNFDSATYLENTIVNGYKILRARWHFDVQQSSQWPWITSISTNQRDPLHRKFDLPRVTDARNSCSEGNYKTMNVFEIYA